MKSVTRTRITQRAQKKPKTVAHPPAKPWLRFAPVLLVLILLCGLGLRLLGLSHGLAEGEVYHPDTPRLMWATREFLDGTYFFRVNNLDYDGYPYFYSHVVEYSWRGARAVSSFTSRLLRGAASIADCRLRNAESEIRNRRTDALFWLARFINVALSTLTILVIYRIAARSLLGPTTGLIAAAFLAFSPMNIAMAHFATNDTAVCFFTTLAVLFAVRICRFRNAGPQVGPNLSRAFAPLPRKTKAEGTQRRKGAEAQRGLTFHNPQSAIRNPQSAMGSRDYLLGGALIAFAFSAKYHGGIVGVTCLLAHILRFWPPKKTLGKEALSQLSLMAVAFLIVLLLANPSLLISPSKAFHDFRQYCRYIPTAKLTASQMRLGFFAKAGLSFTENFPILLRSLGVVISVIAFTGLIHAFCRGKKLVVLASFPLLYLLLTFLSKPIQQRFYLAAPLPIMFVLAAAFLVEMTRIKRVRAVAITAVVVLVIAAMFYLVKSSITETFFFLHRDTRKLAKKWARENIPSSYKIKSGDYTFALERPQKAESSYQGTVFLSSSLRPAPLPQDSFLLKAFDLEKDALPTFRNPRIEIHAPPSPLLSEGFALPVYQRIPSQERSELIFAEGATFYRDDKMMGFRPAKRGISRTLVSDEPIDSAIVIVRNGSSPGSARIRLGGVTNRRPFFLGPCGIRWKEFRGLRKSFPSSASRYFYRLSASGSVPEAVLLLAVSPDEKGVALYNIGEYDAAHPFLVRASRNSRSPVLAAMAYISGELSMSGASPDEQKALLEKASLFNGDLTPETIRSAFGISLDYLHSLPYLSFKLHEAPEKGFHSVSDISASDDWAAALDREPPKGGIWQVGTPPMILEPGCYLATLRVRCESAPNPNATVRSIADCGLQIADSAPRNAGSQSREDAKRGIRNPKSEIRNPKLCLLERGMKTVIAEKEFSVSSLSEGYTDLRFPFEKPAEVGECWVVLRSAQYVPVLLDRLEVRPDPLKSLSALQRLLRIVSSAPDSLPAAGPLDYEPLLLLGRHRLTENQPQQALRYYLLAHQLRPDLAEPIRRIRKSERMDISLPPEDLAEMKRILARVKTQMDAVEAEEANVVFEDDMRLTGYAMTRGPFRPGEKIGISLYWSVPRTRRIRGDLIVWVHLLDRSGAKVLQLDHYLSEDLMFPQKPERITPLLNHEAEIPTDTPPGTYRIELGLWISLRDWRATIVSTALPRTRDSVTLREIVIEPPSAPN